MGSSAIEIPPIEITWLSIKCFPGEKRLPVVVWDLDSTLANTEHRRWLIDQILADDPTATWVDYSMLCADDEPIPGAVHMVKLLSGSCLQLILTGRSEQARDLTVAWLDKHEVRVDGLVMRPAVTEGPVVPGSVNVRLKVNWINQLRDLGYDVQLIVEDWKEAAEQLAEETGIPVLRATQEPVAVPGGA